VGHLPVEVFRITSCIRYNDSLQAGRSEFRTPVGAGFSVPDQAGPRAHPASSTMGTGFLSPGVKRPGRGFVYPQSMAEVKDTELV
jgi:hypothetical protein